MYKRQGYIITKNARSEYIPEMQIIDQETFEKANDIISRRSAKTAQDRRIAHTSQNPTLLAGIVSVSYTHLDVYKRQPLRSILRCFFGCREQR